MKNPIRRSQEYQHQHDYPRTVELGRREDEMKGEGRISPELDESKGGQDKMNKDIRILLVEHNELIRYGLRHMLEQERDIEVVGDCANAEEAFSQMAKLQPDIVLMDTHMSGMSGIEAMRHLKRNGLNYGGNVIMLADSVEYRVEALEAGAASYLLKDVTRAALTQAIREVYWGRQLSADGEVFVEEVVELVVPPSTNAARLLRFMCQLEEMLNDNYVSIMHTVGSWDWGSIITILVWPTALASLLENLASMPDVEDVEKVDEEPTPRGLCSNLPKKFRVLPGSSISPSKRVRVTLKETGMAGKGSQPCSTKIRGSGVDRHHYL